MAIKERKQITGTTEQINAYEGHEGQIVWDKDKKTLVGMSGTAGTNYPLASQAYVDSQFLPLTGGTMLGDILFRPPNGEFSIGTVGTGARLALNEATRENFEGQVILQADNGTKDAYCTLHPNGELRLNNNLVDSIVQQYDEAVRYASGLQIVWFNGSTASHKGNPDSWRFTYHLPFAERSPISVSLNTVGGWGYSTTIQMEYLNAIGCGGTFRRTEGDDATIVTIYGIAIGRWK